MKLFGETSLLVADSGARIAAIITLKGVNEVLATLIAVLTITHLVLKIRKERGEKTPKD